MSKEKNSKHPKQVYYSVQDRPKKKEKDESLKFIDYAEMDKGMKKNRAEKEAKTSEQERLDSINDARSEGESKDLDSSLQR